MICVGLDEHDRAGGKSIAQPPGGESQMSEMTTPEIKPSKSSQRVTQPPGGASTDIFSSIASASDSSSSDTGSENGEEQPTAARRPYRLASNFVLGDDPASVKPKLKLSKKKSAPVVNPVTGEVQERELTPGSPSSPAAAAAVPATTAAVVTAPPEPAKLNRVPPGGHSTPLW